jgi:hypothetical protein
MWALMHAPFVTMREFLDLVPVSHHRGMSCAGSQSRGKYLVHDA